MYKWVNNEIAVILGENYIKFHWIGNSNDIYSMWNYWISHEKKKREKGHHHITK